MAETDDVDTDVKLSEDNQEELTIGDAKEAFTDEKKAINFKGGDYNLTSHDLFMKFQTVDVQGYIFFHQILYPSAITLP